MHEELPFLPVDDMCLTLAGVVRHIVEQLKVCLREDLRNCIAREVGDDFAVCQCAIDAGTHGTEILLAGGRLDRGAGKLPVGQMKSMRLRLLDHALEELGTNLVTEPARTAMDADLDVVHADPEGTCSLLVVDPCHALHLEVVVARAEGSHFVLLAALGKVRHGIRPGALHAAMLLDAFEILHLSIALFDRPARTACEHGIHLTCREMQCSRAAETGRDFTEQGSGKRLLV